MIGRYALQSRGADFDETHTGGRGGVSTIPGPSACGVSRGVRPGGSQMLFRGLEALWNTRSGSTAPRAFATTVRAAPWFGGPFGRGWGVSRHPNGPVAMPASDRRMAWPPTAFAARCHASQQLHEHAVPFDPIYADDHYKSGVVYAEKNRQGHLPPPRVPALCSQSGDGPPTGGSSRRPWGTLYSGHRPVLRMNDFVPALDDCASIRPSVRRPSAPAMWGSCRGELKGPALQPPARPVVVFGRI